MNPSEFAAKWRGVTTGERASAQSHFGDLCRMLGEPTPTDADPTGSWYAFEKGAEKFDGRDGFADVWKKGFFAWEYKGKRKDLKAALRQLVDYTHAGQNRFRGSTAGSSTRPTFFRLPKRRSGRCWRSGA